MKLPILSALLLLLPASLFAQEQITVSATFFGSSSTPIPHDLKEIATTKGINCIASPRCITTSGRNAVAEIVLGYQPTSVAPKGFNPVPLGFIINVTPFLKGENIIYNAQITFSELVSRKPAVRKPQNEIISHDIYISGRVKNDKEIWVDFIKPTNDEKKLSVCLHFKHDVP